jgi:hypothetical protein
MRVRFSLTIRPIARCVVTSTLLRIAPHVDVELFYSNVLFRQPFAQRRQVVEQRIPRRRRLGFQLRRHHAVLHGKFNMHDPQFRRRQSHLNPTVSLLRRPQGAFDSLHKARPINLRAAIGLRRVVVSPQRCRRKPVKRRSRPMRGRSAIRGVYSRRIR